METHLADWLKGTRDGLEAEKILRSCVHCGFCTATCPTYQLLGDELDGPRGRIYLIKQVVEGAQPTESTREHLDRCLTCLSCETTCPSGVRYGHLLDIGRRLVERKVGRPASQQVVRAALAKGITNRHLFKPAMRVGQALRPFLPESLRESVPQRRPPGPWPRREHARRVLLLAGCAQPAMMPRIDAATARVLDAIGVQAEVSPRSGCCGAISQHLNEFDAAVGAARRNVDAWWPYFDPRSARPAEAVLINASGCGAMLKEYAHLLADDPAYADRARAIVERTFDLAQWLPGEFSAALRDGRVALRRAPARRVVFHPPCTLQHAQKVRGAVEAFLASLDVAVDPVAESHLCCGSAGTYSVLQPELSRKLRDRKVANLEARRPEMILSANVGCIGHLQSATQTPVRHWIEWLDDAIA
jgi:glycolate oxidase iron-sulfur subunit